MGYAGTLKVITIRKVLQANCTSIKQDLHCNKSSPQFSQRNVTFFSSLEDCRLRCFAGHVYKRLQNLQQIEFCIVINKKTKTKKTVLYRIWDLSQGHLILFKYFFFFLLSKPFSNLITLDITSSDQSWVAKSEHPRHIQFIHACTCNNSPLPVPSIEKSENVNHG